MLFSEDELVERHVGIGEYRGLEFLHVNAKQIINRVPPQSRMTFRHTINAYRGCSHACAYCASGDTRVLMADGTTRPIRYLQVGDVVVGTIRQGRYRRYTSTTVLDHWSTIRRAFQTALDDGSELISSGDHRFLSNRGWKYVTGAEHGCDQRPFLTPNNRLIGPRSCTDALLRDASDRRGVVSVTDLELSISMFDITTGTGDFIANGVISHNCFARPTHEYLGLNLGEDFERKIVVKVNAVDRVRAELRSPKWEGDVIAMGTNTDPYQRAEGKYHLTRGIVSALGDASNPFSILTKSPLILRDLDLLMRAARRTDVHCALSIGTLDEQVWKATEPGAPHPRKRVDAVRRLADSGITTSVLIAPIIPGWSDRRELLEEVTAACLDAGAVSVSPVVLHLRPGVKEHFLSVMDERRPDLARRLRDQYRGSYLARRQQEEITAEVAQARSRHPSARRRELSRLPLPVLPTPLEIGPAPAHLPT